MLTDSVLFTMHRVQERRMAEIAPIRGGDNIGRAAALTANWVLNLLSDFGGTVRMATSRKIWPRRRVRIFSSECWRPAGWRRAAP